MYTPINGWTKARILKHIEREFVTRATMGDSRSIRCAYRGVGGAKCAVGVFIPDEAYNNDMEGVAVKELLRDYPKLRAYMPLDLEALACLQDIHDLGGRAFPQYVKVKLLGWVDRNVKDKEIA